MEMKNHKIIKDNSGFQPNTLSKPNLMTFPMKPILKYRTRWRCSTPSDMTKIRKSKPKMCFSVFLFLNSKNIGAMGFKNLLRALVDARTTVVIFKEEPNLNAKQLSHFLNLTNHWKCLLPFELPKGHHLNQELVKSLTRFGRCKNLSTSPFLDSPPEQQINIEIIEGISRQLKRLNKLTDLILEIPHSQDAVDNLDYKYFRFLIYLSLSFNHKSTILQHDLSQFVSNVQRRCNLLEELVLIFQNTYSIEPEDAQIWTSFLQSPPRDLKQLQISLFIDEQQQPEGIQAFIEAFKHLKQLQVLKLSLIPPKSHFWRRRPLLFSLDDSLLSLFENLRCLTQLEELELLLPRLNNPTLELFASMLQCLSNLKSLTIRLTAIKSPSEGFVILSEGFKNLHHLKILNLEFVQTNVSSQFMEISSKNLAHLDLTSFRLNLGALSNIPPNSIYHRKERPSLLPFFSDLSHLNQLSHLNLELGGSYHFSDQESQDLSFTLKQLSKLSNLNLSLPQFESNRSYEDLRNVLSCFKDMEKLTHLNLTFAGQSICDQQVEILSSHLAKCLRLESLELKFTIASQLTGRSLYFLALRIRNLLKLHCLVLKFGERTQFDNKVVFGLLEELVILKQLASLEFSYDLEPRKQHTFAPLPENLKDYQNLKRMTSFIVDNLRYI